MAKHLDLEQQEQLDEIKHFWKQYGNLITWVLIAVFGGIAAWNGYQYWQRSQAAQASQMYEEVDRAVQSGDVTRIERALADMNQRFASTSYAQQASLMAAKSYHDKGNLEAARAALTRVAEKSSDDGYKAVARLRLSGLLIETKAFDEALKALDAPFSKEFSGLVEDRRADVFALQGKNPQARAEYEKAYKLFDERADYRRLVEVKLNALGGSSVATAAPPSTAEKK